MDTLNIEDKNENICIWLYDKDEKVVFIKYIIDDEKRSVIELPTGKKEMGEDPEKAARRIARDITGHDIENIQFVGSAYPMLGYFPDKQHYFIASTMKDILPRTLDISEKIEVCPLTKQEMNDMFINQKLVDGKIYTMLGLLAVASDCSAR